MTTALVVTPRTHWFYGWFLPLFCQPVVRLNGVDREASWNSPLVLPVEAGEQVTAVAARYLHSKTLLGAAIADHRITADSGQRVEVVREGCPLARAAHSAGYEPESA